MSEEFRQSAPAPLAPIPFNIAQPFETALDNGLRIVVFENKRLPLVGFRLAFLAGEAHEPADSVGLTSALASMLSEGTENYSSRRLAEKIERLGANISVGASDDYTIVGASSLAVYGSDVLDLMAEIVFKPIFPESELNLYKQNTIESLKFNRSQPGFLANEQTARILYGTHPYATISPQAEDIEKITRESLIALQKQLFVPNNAIFIVVGDVDKTSLIGEIEAKFGGWIPAEIAAKEFPKPPTRTARTLTIVDRPGSAQSNIVISSLAIERTNPDYFPFTLMNQILGAGASSRVFMNLREEKGYTYGAYTRLDTKKLSGEFEATAEVRTSVTGDSLKEFFYELNRIRDEKVGADELQDAKNFLAGVFPIRAETLEGLTGLIVSQKLAGLPDDYLQTYRDKINAVTIEEVAATAKKYIEPEKMAIVIVGDAGEVLPQVKSYAHSIEIYDTEGNTMDINSYNQTESAANTENAPVSGKWNLTVSAFGQELNLALKLEQTDANFTGILESALMKGTIQDGKVSGNKLTANLATNFQGQSLDIAINAVVDSDKINGALSSPILPTPYNFSGTREV